MGTDVHGVWQAKKDGMWVDIESKWDQDRHYLLFSWLADVRNGFGFAGVPTYDPIKPIAERRGLPDDFQMDDGMHYTTLEAIDPGRREWAEEDKENGRYTAWLGSHSHSWLTADEILAAERLGSVHKHGVVTIEQFKAWDGKSTPEAWCGGVSGPGVEVADSPASITPASTHVQIEWNMPDKLDYFVDEVRRLKELHGEVRLVFGFDS